jgi:hypothetical protein
VTRRPGIGHNAPPPDGTGWNAYCWRRARRELMGPRLPVEIIRLRVARARQLGLSYPQYASILMGSGRDIVGFLFTVGGLQLRLSRRLAMPEPVRERLAAIGGAELAAFAPSGEDPDAFRLELRHVSGAPIAAAAPEPEPPVSWPAARAAIRAALDPLGLPGDAVVMVGTAETEAHMAAAGRLAKFLETRDYFAPA